MIVGSVSAAYIGTALVHRVSEHLLERFILVFLVIIGTELIVGVFLPQQVTGLMPEVPIGRPGTRRWRFKMRSRSYVRSWRQRALRGSRKGSSGIERIRLLTTR